MDYVLTSFKIISTIFSILAVQTGAHAVLRPASFAESFGLPIDLNVGQKSRGGDQKETLAAQRNIDSGLSYVTMMGVRQLGTGVIILIFASRGKWMEIATILSVVGLLVATTDAYNLWSARKPGLARFHALPGIAIAAHAILVLSRDSGVRLYLYYSGPFGS